MADTKDSRPPVVVEYTISWPGLNGHETDTFEIPRAEWEAMTPAERNTRIEEVVNARFVDLCGWGWHISSETDYKATEEQK